MLSHHARVLFDVAMVIATPAGLALVALGAGIALRLCRDIDTPRNEDRAEDEEREPGDDGLPLLAA